MATLKDVALKSNVSIATVSRVLNNKAGLIGITAETQQKVLEVARELNYQPDKSARNLRLGRSLKAILFMYNYQETEKYGLGEHAFFSHPFFSHMLHGIQLGVADKGYYVSYISAIEQKIEPLSQLLDGDISGVITWGLLREEIKQLIAAKHIPMVAIEPYSSDVEAFPVVYVNNDMAIRQALEHLVHLGHRRIGFVSFLNLDGTEFLQFQERRLAFQRWVAHFGLETFPDQELFGIDSGVPEYRPDQEVIRWLKLPLCERPTAAIFGSDLLALRAMRTFRSHGIQVPDDFSIVGVDDIDFAQYIDPPMTTVRIPKEQMGELAVSLLDRMMNGRKTKLRNFVNTELMIRSTTRAIKS